MNAPTVTKQGSNNSKSTGTTLAVTVTGSYAIGDLIVIGFAMDPAVGAISFALSAGTATIGSWTTEKDAANGSGTSGVRTAVAWARVATAGTITSVTVTHPSAAARAVEAFQVVGWQVLVQSSVASNVAAQAVTPSPGNLTILCFVGVEGVTGTAVTTSTSDGNWTKISSDATDVGTSGGGGATNISCAFVAYSRDNAPGTSETASASVSGNQVWTNVVFQSLPLPVAATTAVSQGVARASLF